MEFALRQKPRNYIDRERKAVIAKVEKMWASIAKRTKLDTIFKTVVLRSIRELAELI